MFGYLAQYGNWQAPFIVAAALLVAGAAVWAFWLDPDKPILAELSRQSLASCRSARDGRSIASDNCGAAGPMSFRPLINET